MSLLTSVIQKLRTTRYGNEMREHIVTAFEKLEKQVEQNTSAINGGADDRISKLSPTKDDVGKVARAVREGEVEWVDAGQPTNAQVSEAVGKWFEENPEQSPEIQDGEITESKIEPNLLQRIENKYVTPEMFGAVGDGRTDDTVAIQTAIDTGEKVVLSHKTYRTSQTLVIKGSGDFTEFDAKQARINYVGEGSAILVQGMNGGNIDIGYIYATTGNCIEFFSSNGTQDRTQYVNLNFLRLCTDGEEGKCIYIHNSGTGWTNNNIVHGGEIIGGKYGIYIKCEATDIKYNLNGWKFSNIGFEGSKKNIYVDGGTVGAGYIEFEWIRDAEHLDTSILLELHGVIKHFHYCDRFSLAENRVVIGNDATLREVLIESLIVNNTNTVVLGRALFYDRTVKRYVPNYTDEIKGLYFNSLPNCSGGYIQVDVRGSIAIVRFVNVIPTKNSADWVVEGNPIDERYRPATEVNGIVLSNLGVPARVWVRTNGTISFSTFPENVGNNQQYRGELIYFIN